MNYGIAFGIKIGSETIEAINEVCGKIEYISSLSTNI